MMSYSGSIQNLLLQVLIIPLVNQMLKDIIMLKSLQKNNHLGDDWNGVNGGNSDLGDPIYTIGNGYVVYAKDIKGGWGM